MNGYARFAAVVGLAVLAVGGGLLLLGGGQSVSPPSSSPSPSPSRAAGNPALTPRSVTSTAFPVRVSLTVPGSWTQSADTPEMFSIYWPATFRPEIPLVGIGVMVVTNAYRDICDPDQGLLDPPLGSEVQDVVDFLLAAEPLHATVVDPDVQLGGTPGMTGIALEEAFAPVRITGSGPNLLVEECQDPMALWPINGEPYGNFASERSRFYVIGDGTRRFVVQILATDGIWQTQLSTAEAALQTLRFE